MKRKACNQERELCLGDIVQETLVGSKEDIIIAKVVLMNIPEGKYIKEIFKTDIQVEVEEVKGIEVEHERYKAVVRGKFIIKIAYLTVDNTKGEYEGSQPFEQFIYIKQVVSNLLKAKICIEDFSTQKINEGEFITSILWDTKVRGMIEVKQCGGCR